MSELHSSELFCTKNQCYQSHWLGIVILWDQKKKKAFLVVTPSLWNITPSAFAKGCKNVVLSVEWRQANQVVDLIVVVAMGRLIGFIIWWGFKKFFVNIPESSICDLRRYIYLFNLINTFKKSQNVFENCSILSGW